MDAASNSRELGQTLLSLRGQIERLAQGPAVGAAHQATRQVASVLEPVWSILEAGDAGSGIGHLRRLGTVAAHDDIEKLNDEVLAEAADAYGRLNLVAPPAGAVWRALSRPSVALVRSVGAQSRDITAATLEPTVRPAMPVRLLAGQNDASIVPALRVVLRRWCDLVRHTTGEQREVARLTLAAAMLARGAVLDGDTDTVAWFVERWLGLTPTGYRVDGTSAALLEGGWVRRRVDEEFSAVRDTVTKLRTESLDQHRLHRPVWHTQLRGRPIALLYDPIGSSAELIDTIGAADQALLEIETADVMRHIESLPSRTQQVFALLADDYRPREIAEELSLSAALVLGGMVLVIHLGGLPGAALMAGGGVAAAAVRRHPRRRRGS